MQRNNCDFRFDIAIYGRSDAIFRFYGFTLFLPFSAHSTTMLTLTKDDVKPAA